MLLLARYSPGQYLKIVQEDRPIEWATVWLFGVAGIIQLRKALSNRLPFDILVGLFFLFVAGEEFSWGQRLLGYSSPEYFLAHNYQQEVNLHNLPGTVLKPKWILLAALAGYGILLPCVALFGRLRALLSRVGATPPPFQLTPWFFAAIILLVWYPYSLTGEWVEALAGGLFVAAIVSRPRTLLILLALALIFGVGMTKVTDAVEHSHDSERSACARNELEGLLKDLTSDGTSTEKLRGRQSFHKRVWTAVSEGSINRQERREFETAQCSAATAEQIQERRSYFVDPWGTSYWLSVTRVEEGLQRVTIYSFGPNRRRDGSSGAVAGDDISVMGYARYESKIKLPRIDAPPSSGFLIPLDDAP